MGGGSAVFVWIGYKGDTDDKNRQWGAYYKEGGNVVDEQPRFWFDEGDVGDDIGLVDKGRDFLAENWSVRSLAQRLQAYPSL